MILSTATHGPISWVLFNTIQNPSFVSGVGCGILMGWIWMRMRYKANKDMISDDTTPMSMPEKISGYDEGAWKMVLVVRNDLKMGKGKVAAQCSHAAVDAVKRCLEKCPEYLFQWQECGQPKIVLKTDSEEDLKILAQEARKHGLVAAIITDAGRTQIAPNTKTVLAVGPGPADHVDRVTGHLRLY